MAFALHRRESATGAHVSPILSPPLTLPIPSLWVVKKEYEGIC